MRKQKGINTTVLHKIGKNETASMNTFIKFSTTMNCWLDAIVERTINEIGNAK